MDIVAKLRAAQISEKTSYEYQLLVNYAADEIERLRSKLAEYENAPVRLRHILATGKLPGGYNADD